MNRREVAQLEALAARSERGTSAKVFRSRKLSCFEKGLSGMPLGRYPHDEPG